MTPLTTPYYLIDENRLLRNLRIIWGRPVHLQMRVDDDQYLLTCEDPSSDALKKEKINASTPPPAHIIQ